MLTSFSVSSSISFSGQTAKLVFIGRASSSSARNIFVTFDNPIGGPNGMTTTFGLSLLLVDPGQTARWEVNVSRYNAPSTLRIVSIVVTDASGNTISTNTNPSSLGNATTTITGSVADLLPPAVSSITIPHIVTKGESLTAKAFASDNGAGVATVSIELDKTLQASPFASRFLTLHNGIDSFADGSSAYTFGTSNATPGEYKILGVSTTDLAGNSRSYGTDKLAALGLPTSIIVASGKVATSGNDVLADRTSGASTLRGEAGNDQLFGGAGDDILIGGVGADTLNGGQGSDTADYTTAISGVAVDMLYPYFSTGDAYGDTFVSIENVTGSAFDDIIYGDGGANTLSGGQGDDHLDGDAGNDILDGGAGIDTASFAFSQTGVSASLATGQADGDKLISIENLIGSNYADVFIGDAADNSLSGSGGDDRLIGGAGADKLFGGPGYDIASYATASVGIRLDLATPAASTGDAAGDTLESVEQITGSDHADELLGDENANILSGGKGDDVLEGRGGADQLKGDEGSDTVSYADAAEGVTASLADPSGNAGAAAGDTYTSIENLTGSVHADALTGDEAGNRLDGLGGAGDKLDGRGGDDILVVGVGDSELQGGAGVDTVVLPDMVGDGTSGVALSLNVTGPQATAVGAMTVSGIENVTGSSAGDELTGTDSDNSLLGRGGDDILDGGAGDDTLTGGAGDDDMRGGEDVDTAVFSGARSDYGITVTGGVFVIVDQRDGSPDGTDTVEAVERFQFADGAVTAAQLPFVRPTAIAISSNQVVENAAAGTVVGRLVATDADAGDTHTFVLAGGAAGQFEIVGDEVRVKQGAALDFETQSTLEIEARAIDAVGLAFTQKLSLEVADANEAPTAVVLTNHVASLDENVTLGERVRVADIAVTDDALGSEILFVGGADADHFEIVGDKLYIKAGTVLDFETQRSYSVTVEVDDAEVGGAPDASATFDMKLNDLRAPPIFGDAKANKLFGTPDQDDISGLGGDDYIDGLAGGDWMTGGGGNDTYVIDDAGDRVYESAGGGTDTLLAWVSVKYLAENVEILILQGAENLDASGNWARGNRIVGNDGDNILNGISGFDTLIGGRGNDYYHYNPGDVIVEKAGGGIDTIRATTSYTLGANLENLELFGQLDANGTGNELDNVITGDYSANILDGRAGADTLVGGNDGDTYIVDDAGDTVVELAGDHGTDTVQSSVSFALPDFVENLTLTGTGSIGGTGNAVANVIVGNGGANVIRGGGGADVLTGGAGLDSLSYAGSGAAVKVQLVAGKEALVSGGDAQGDKAIGFENVIGSDHADEIVGDGGANVLDGGAGSDTLAGGAGADTYVVDDALDLVIEAPGGAGGIDTVRAWLDWTLGANLERLALLGSADLAGTGNSLANIITGNSGDNVLDGQGGADILIGGAGDDIYVVDATGDVITEFKGGGIDTVRTALSYTLKTELERLELTGSANANATGNVADNSLTGNSGNNVLNGMAGKDEMAGGAGNDTYIVDNAFDTVIESDGAEGGIDVVHSSVSFTLGDSVENLTLAGSGNISGTGNGAANIIVGNAGANVIRGGGGADVLAGGAGHDTLSYAGSGGPVSVQLVAGKDAVVSGGDADGDKAIGFESIVGSSFGDLLAGDAGANVLDGGAGADVMRGGLGNDVYVVDDAGDTVEDGVKGGFDQVRASIDYRLGAEIENLLLLGSDDLAGTGNSLLNIITGNAGNNHLDGGVDTLADTLIGGRGDDTYVVRQGDKVVEKVGEGVDTVRTGLLAYTLGSFVENLELTGTASSKGTGNSLANRIAGNDAANVLDGAVGDDVLVGGLGADVLVGGLGRDTFLYLDLLDSAPGVADQIRDFQPGDRIDVGALRAFNGGQAFVLDALGVGTFDAGHIRQTLVGGNLVLEFNADADPASEMQIVVQKRTVGLTAGDLVT